MSDARDEVGDRRPIKTRDSRLARAVADRLIAARVSPNAISLSSIGFAAASMLCLMGSPAPSEAVARGLFLLAAVGIQGRLLANLFDGMVAVDSGQASRAGELYNEVPDRVADAAILVGAGFAVGASPTLGYLAAIVAVFVAYVRALGASLGAGQDFGGPMAKPQRMATLTAACLYLALAPADWPLAIAQTGFGTMSLALALICLGGGLTAWRRIVRIAEHLGHGR